MINHGYLSYFSEALSNANMISLTPIKCAAAHFIGVREIILALFLNAVPI